jgi:cell division protein FtsZ
MKDSGVAIMGTGIASGEDRSMEAMDAALASPLLNNNDITGADNILINITSGENEVSMDEIGLITDHISQSASKHAHIIWGTGQDKNLGERVSVTVIATGFESTSIPELYIKKPRTDRVKLSESSARENEDMSVTDTGKGMDDKSNIQRTFEFNLNSDPLEFVVSDSDGEDPEKAEKKSRELADRVRKLRKSHEKMKEQLYNKADSNESIDELENEPAYVRKKVKIDDSKPSEESNISKYSLSEDEEKNSRLREDNAYLHDNVD